MTRQQAIRARCVDCCGHNLMGPAQCEEEGCWLFPFRLKRNGGRGEKSSAIKNYCLECCNGSKTERDRCAAVTCPLHQYRNTNAIKDMREARRHERQVGVERTK